MASEPKSFWGRLKRNIRSRMISGLLIVVPMGITIFILGFLYHTTAGFLEPLVKRIPQVKRLIDHAPQSRSVEFFIEGISILILVALVYLVGVITSYVVGRRMVGVGEAILLRVPLVKTIYSATKQVVHTISLPDRTAFKSVVLVEFPRRGLWAVGFATGTLLNCDGTEMCKVFLPTTPNPTTGFFEIVPTSDVTFTTLSVEDGFKMIVSGGIVAPARIERQAAGGEH